MIETLRKLWRGDDAQDIAEYAVMLAVILVLVVGTIRLVGSTPTTRSPPLPAQFSRPHPAVVVAL